MKKELPHPSPEKAEEALSLLRQVFIDMNPDLVAKIEAYKTTKSFSGTIGGKEGHHFDFKDFFETLQEGFASPNIRALFECLMHLYFFKSCVDLRVNFYDYINYDSFKEEEYIKTSKKHARVITALNIVEAYAITSLDNLGVKNREFLTELGGDYRSLRDMLRIMYNAKRISLCHYGDHEFIISKIQINNKPFVMTEKVVLKDAIIYTDKPEQIISLAMASHPGIYLIANVPYGHKVDTAFYLLFVNNSDAILVDNNKHSYRDQVYRTKTDGTDGKEAWLDRRYENTYLPIEDVLELFDNRDRSKDLLSKNSSFSFKVIKKLSECSPACILWTQAFVDNCIHQFKTTDVLQKVSPALALEFLYPYSEKTPSLPAVYNASLPRIEQLDLSWRPEQIGLERHISGDQFTSMLKEISVPTLFEKHIPAGLTSEKQVKASLAYSRRKIVASKLEQELCEDFLDNAFSVREKIQNFVNENPARVVERAFEDRGYPVTLYVTFGTRVDEIPEGQSSAVAYRSVLYTSEKPEEVMGLRSRDNNRSVSRFVIKNRPSDILLTGGLKCCYCREHKPKYNYVLNFLDYTQFKNFFEISSDVEKTLPNQLRKYLNQSSTLYVGNSILNDIDPVCLIKNPWWVAGIDRDKITWNSSDPYLKIVFSVCGFCRRKLLKNKRS